MVESFLNINGYRYFFVLGKRYSKRNMYVSIGHPSVKLSGPDVNVKEMLEFRNSAMRFPFLPMECSNTDVTDEISQHTVHHQGKMHVQCSKVRRSARGHLVLHSLAIHLQ